MVASTLEKPSHVNGDVEVDTRTDFDRELDEIAISMAMGHIKNRDELRSRMVEIAESYNMLFAHACLLLGGRIKVRLDKGYMSYEMIRTIDAGMMELVRLDPVS